MFHTQVCNNPLYASMVLSWSMTEVIRYSFYACSLVGMTPFVLLYLRYTTFYILYPSGASSEAFLIYASLPTSFQQSWLQDMWKLTDYIRAGLFVVWWPGDLIQWLTWSQRFLITSLRSVRHVHLHGFSKTESTWTWDQKCY